MKKILSLVLLSSFAFAQDAKKATTAKLDEKHEVAMHDQKGGHDAKDAVVKNILNLTMFTPEFDKTMEETIKALAKQINLVDKEKEIYNKFMKSFKHDVMKQLSDLYVKNFSLDELKKIEEWQKSPLAKKLTSLAPDISNITMQTSQKAMFEAINSFQDEMAKRAKKNAPQAAPKQAPKRAAGQEDVIVEEIIEE